MKKLFICIAVVIAFASCGGHAIDSSTYKQLKTTVSDFTRIYSDKYKDDTWGNENFGRIYHLEFHREGKLRAKLDESNISIKTEDGLKIYREVSRKDIIYNKTDDSYVIRNDFIIVAIVKDDKVSIQKPEVVISQYYWLQKDKEDHDIYKIIDVYPTIMKDEFIQKQTFVDNYKDFTQDENIKVAIESIKNR
jgi:hypothetical protein